ncbi:MAG: helix-turn-helix transcriptional regulator [Candidatus Thiodiazotropha taylori]|nr:helix-turn-helix transcriptional regulator [Candidatus Thiodiazotropha taylori]
MSFGSRIQERLIEIGKKPVDLARYLNIKEPSVSAWFSGDTKSLKADTCLGAARFLGVNPFWLYLNTGKKFGNLSPEQMEWVEFGDQLPQEKKQQIIDLFTPDNEPPPKRSHPENKDQKSKKSKVA